MKYKHTNINLLFNEMLEDLDYIRKKAIYVYKKNNR